MENQRKQTCESNSQVLGKAMAKLKGCFINVYLTLVLGQGEREGGSPTF